MIWDEAKRIKNLEKHQLDFADAGLVLSNRYRLVFEREAYHAWLEKDFKE
jgi:uncharacterized DUF497 family protein